VNMDILELENGEFNFETLNTLYIQDTNYEFIEYHLFIKAIYNLLERLVIYLFFEYTLLKFMNV